MRRFLFGVGAGLTAGYALYRLVEAVAALRSPAAPFAKDAARYGRIRRNLEVSGAVRSLAIAVALSEGGFGTRLQHLTAAFPLALRPAVLALAGALWDSLIELPASFIEDFELERRFSLSDQPPGAWLSDHLKALGLSSVFMAALTIPFATLLRRKPNAWPFLATFALVPFFILMGLVVPVYIAPLFNRFQPLEGPLEERLRRLASRFGVGDAAILRMDMSRQTKKANAYVTGLFRTHRIVVGDTLLKSFPDDETEFVVAHELGHYVARDSWRLCIFGVLVAGTTFLLSNLAMPPTERQVRSRRYTLPSLRADDALLGPDAADSLCLYALTGVGSGSLCNHRDARAANRMCGVHTVTRAEFGRRGNSDVVRGALFHASGARQTHSCVTSQRRSHPFRAKRSNARCAASRRDRSYAQQRFLTATLDEIRRTFRRLPQRHHAYGSIHSSLVKRR